jgi:hypothetical protein
LFTFFIFATLAGKCDEDDKIIEGMFFCNCHDNDAMQIIVNPVDQ